MSICVESCKVERLAVARAAEKGKRAFDCFASHGCIARVTTYLLPLPSNRPITRVHYSTECNDARTASFNISLRFSSFLFISRRFFLPAFVVAVVDAALHELCRIDLLRQLRVPHRLRARPVGTCVVLPAISFSSALHLRSLRRDSHSQCWLFGISR